ncbi:hypothetical protein, partial [Thermosulfurimonas dismutans]|uniref:hypothetical protein n=1 Tax=Thermosulfurimonas dismutans TaxID=999894 RepID=UPI001ABF4482
MIRDSYSAPSRTAQGIIQGGGENEYTRTRSQALAAKRGKSLSALIREQLEALIQEKMNLISRHQLQKL